MIFRARIRPPGSFLVIAGDINAPMPEFSDRPQRLWANEWCVGVGTLSEVDGETDVIVSDEPQDSRMPVVFDGVIDSPGGIVTVSDAYLVEVANLNVHAEHARIIVMANDRREPDRILIIVTPDASSG